MYHVIPSKDMTWVDLADAICEHLGLRIEIYRGFVWNDETCQTGGKYMWRAVFWKKDEDITNSRYTLTLEETVKYAIQTLLGNCNIRSPYNVFRFLEKINWEFSYTREYTFELSLDDDMPNVTMSTKDK